MTDEEREVRALVNRTLGSVDGDKDKALLALASQVLKIRSVSLSLSKRHEGELRKAGELLQRHSLSVNSTT